MWMSRSLMDRSLKIFWKVLCCSATAVWQLSFEVKSRRDYSPATSVAGDNKNLWDSSVLSFAGDPRCSVLGGNFHQLLHFSCGSCADASSLCWLELSVHGNKKRESDRHLWWMSLAMLGLLALQFCDSAFSRCGLITAPPAAQTWLWWGDGVFNVAVYFGTTSATCHVPQMPTFVTLVSFAVGSLCSRC